MSLAVVQCHCCCVKHLLQLGCTQYLHICIMYMYMLIFRNQTHDMVKNIAEGLAFHNVDSNMNSGFLKCVTKEFRKNYSDVAQSHSRFQ